MNLLLDARTISTYMLLFFLFFGTGAPTEYVDSRTNHSEESGDDDNLDELTSRYFLQGRSELNKKLHSGDSAIPPKFAGSFQTLGSTTDTGRNGGISVSNARHVNISANISSSAIADDGDDDGWISVGPKHQRGGHHGHHDRFRKKSFGQDGFERRKSQSGQRPHRGSNARTRPSMSENTKPFTVPHHDSTTTYDDEAVQSDGGNAAKTTE